MRHTTDFTQLSDGSHVMTSAFQLSEHADRLAREQTKNRSFADRLLRRPSPRGTDILRAYASQNFHDEFITLHEGVLSIPMWQGLDREAFQTLVGRAIEEAQRNWYRGDPVHIKAGYRGMTRMFAQWLENTLHRPFFQWSEGEIRSVIAHIRSLAQSL